MIVRTGATWQSVLAQKYGVQLYDNLTDLLSYYFGRTARRVVLLSISSHHKLPPDSSALRVINIENLPPAEFNRLVLSCDLVVTDNEIGYVLAKTIGRVPGLVFVNSFQADEILAREKPGSMVSTIVRRLETHRCGSVYPHKIFPIPADADQFADDGSGWRNGNGRVVSGSRVRLGRMVSSPFLKVELYGGQETRDTLASVLRDASYHRWLQSSDAGYIERLNALPDGAEVLASLMRRSPSTADTVLS